VAPFATTTTREIYQKMDEFITNASLEFKTFNFEASSYEQLFGDDNSFQPQLRIISPPNMDYDIKVSTMYMIDDTLVGWVTVWKSRRFFN
jgi:hypothetical protein